MFHEKWSKETESELKDREEEEMSEKEGLCWYLEYATAPLIALGKIEYKHLFLHLWLINQSNSQSINTGMYV